MANQKVNDPKAPKSIFRLLDENVKIESVFQNGLPFRYLPYILYVTLLGVLYIGNSHWADRLSREYITLKKENKDLQAEYATIKQEYMFKSKRTEVVKMVRPLHLIETDEAPQKVVIQVED